MQTLSQFIGSHHSGTTSSKNERGNNDILGAAKIYKPHSVLCRQDDDDDTIFIVKSGWALLYRGLLDGERQVIDTPLWGDVVGFRSVDGPRFASLASITELAVHEVSRKALVEHILSGGNFGNRFACSLARLNAILAEHLVNVGRRNAMSRTAHFLLELEERLSSVGLSVHGRYECPLTQHELADILGMTTVHVNRTLSELRKADLVSFKAGHVEILNRKNLVKVAGFDNEYLR
ncbi:Crp/Fnr family transcriptional regulator [Mesorhizobium sp. M4B.F.Ca.ET.017.02.2.1]|uniref:Crp/Fnr family transcriptional regulator n=1 Tax=Mesorhizobium sp. M4B.F.Ca.ET.017.02.2.1 TaxID=2496649 RepID=UPI000FCAD3DE|nr:Crp/Fnr family transcriptional regulator [Mesorhizobium sp. M4B.F.Ca.ET.017.02.2.1]RVD20991.1 Crp/Fnr family transcriptional regulator [Mesorhizobium sp. M4B.F.Ca.ET.017.02.2.1]